MARGRWRWQGLAFATFCLTASACHQRRSVGAAAAESGFVGALTLRVVNHNWLDITIYLLQGNRRDRIGTATATGTSEFHLPLQRFSAGGEYQLYGDPVGSRQTVRSERLHARDGDVVTWTLEDDLAHSFVDVR